MLHNVFSALHFTGLSAFVRDRKVPNTYVCQRYLSEFLS